MFVLLVRHRQVELISDGNKIIEVKVLEMKLINFKDFMEKKLINDTMNESELQRVSNYPIYPRVAKNYSDNGLVIIDNRS